MPLYEYYSLSKLYSTRKIMQITVIFIGPLADLVGRDTVTFELPHGAVYGDLLDDIGSRFGDKLQDRFWNHEATCFNEQVLVTGTDRDYNDHDMPLVENENIRIIPFLAGG
jgi:molybdopterin converting factor small subunit